MLQFYNQQTDFGSSTSSEGLLQLLLFIDERYTPRDNIQRIQTYLQKLKAEYDFSLNVIEISKQPQLVEHFKLVATPALVKISPGPQQTIAGSNLIDQLQKWWPRWQESLQLLLEADESKGNDSSCSESKINSIGYSAEIMRLSDEIFRLQQEKEELLEQLRFKDQILAMLAHDLRSPLTAASIAVETLELSHTQGDSQKIQSLKEQLFKQARKQFRVMNRMIGDLLQASKSMSAKLTIEPHQLNLKPLCQEIISQFAGQIQEQSQQLEDDIPQDLPPVYADEELIRQLLVNVLENATKYTPQGGKISLSILHRTSQKIQVSICDTGPGIPLEKQERIFEGHFRLKRDEKKEGYGLGLAMCRKIVQAHYGQIWVDSSPGQGSCFHFTLPVYRQ
ncbi:MAG: histidine kinase [Xenococcaceae cyanobacterium MO_188.B29]|nr:histidine kinase [Xenococcaceae cyanobacterium MO_188.B29]